MHPGMPAPTYQVGPYRLLGRIGEGGMGVVHLAEAPDGRRLALKLLRPDVLGDDEVRERLVREVNALRRVRSPRVAQILDADPWGDLPYVATRYVPGLPLTDHLRRWGPLRGADLRRFAIGLLEAVTAVHDVGVLHRDIKPSNVLVEGRSPVLIDFGLARLADDPRMTRVGWLLGTPGYLAPEILYGDDATTASDVHSWAATVAFAASGRPPYGTGPDVAVMDRVRRGEHLLHGVPADLRPLLVSCLAPDPGRRPGTAQIRGELMVHHDAPPRQPAPASDGATAATRSDQTIPIALADWPDTVPTANWPDAGPAAIATAPVAASVAASSPTVAIRAGATRVLPSGSGQPPGAPPRTPPRTAPEPATTQAARRWHAARRSLVMFVLTALVATGFALAPYLCVVVTAAIVWVVRALSLNTEALASRRRWAGRQHWYDAVVAVLSFPWHLLAAAAGTLVLLAWSVCTALVTGVAYYLFGLPLLPGLLLMGVTLAVNLWWGPASRRLRQPTRRTVLRATSGGSGWVAVAGLVAGVVVCAYLLSSNGVKWDPLPGPPWRSGTMLGSVADYL